MSVLCWICKPNNLAPAVHWLGSYSIRAHKRWAVGAFRKGKKMSAKNAYRLNREWLTYRSVMPDNISAIQIQETRRAFYAGASGLLCLILRQLEPGVEPTDNDLNMMNEIEAEIKEFAADIQKG